MRKIRQLMAMLLCMSMLLIFTPDVAGADTIGDKGLDETLFQEWAEESGGRFTAEALKEFALNLQNEYVPRILGGITETFSFAQKPSAEGMKIRLKLYNNSYKRQIWPALRQTAQAICSASIWRRLRQLRIKRWTLMGTTVPFTALWLMK